MITSELKDGIVWVTVDGEMEPQVMMREVGKWLPKKDAFSGFITDLRKMSPTPSMEIQKDLEAWRKKNNSGKPHALLGRTNALSVLVQMYVRVTKAANTRYFMNPYAATAWIKSFDRK